MNTPNVINFNELVKNSNSTLSINFKNTAILRFKLTTGQF